MTYVTVYDGRNPASPTRERFDRPASVIIEMCNEAPKSKEQILAAVQAQSSEANEQGAAIDTALDVLTKKGILYQERGKYFTLAIPEHPYY